MCALSIFFLYLSVPRRFRIYSTPSSQQSVRNGYFVFEVSLPTHWRSCNGIIGPAMSASSTMLSSGSPCVVVKGTSSRSICRLRFGRRVLHPYQLHLHPHLCPSSHLDCPSKSWRRRC